MRNKALILGLILIITLSLTGCNKNDEQITDLAQLKGGKTFAVQTGTYADKFVLQSYPDARLKYFNTVLDCVIAVRDGKADATVYDKPIMENILAKNRGLVILPEILVKDKYGIAVQKQNQELKTAIDSVITEIKANGTYDDMMKRWFPQQGDPGPMPDIQLSGANGTLRFGTAASGEPIAYVDKTQQIIGFDIELAERIAQKLGKKLEVVNMDFGGLIPALQAGKVDMIGSGISITPERAKEVLFSESYYDGGIVVVVRDNNRAADSKRSGKLRTADDLKDKRIGVLLGSTHDIHAHKYYPQATIMQYKTHADIVVAVKTGRVDAGFYNHETLLELLKKDPELGILKANVERNPIAMGFKKNGELRDRFNTFLQESKTSGVYEDMVKRWMTEGRTDMPAIKNPKNNGRLVVGVVSTKGLPFCTIKDNRLVGFDIELAERFAAYLGKELVLEDMEFSSLINALEGNKIDMIASTLSITEERKKQIDFSDPYYEMGMTIFALKKNIDTSASNKMSQLDDIADKRVGVATGTIFDGFVAQKYPRAKIFRYQGSADMVVAIKSEKIDVAVIDALTAGLLVENNPELGILTDNVMAIPMGVGFNKNNPALREKFNHYLKEIKASGIYDEIYRRWYVEDPEKAVMPDIKFDSAGPKLVLGVSVADLPYVAVKDGKYVGLDIELIERFAAREGYNLEIITMEFSSLIAALAAGKVDMISDGIAITEERSKQIDFSDCYLEGKSAVIGLKKNMARYEQEPEGSVYKSIIKNIEDSFYNNLIVENRYLLIVGGLKVTAVISVFSVLLGTLLGGLVCFLRMARNRLLSGIARVYISILRGTPVLVLLMIIFYVVFASVNIDPVIVAVIAFGLNFGAYVSEMFRTSIESVDEGQIEAGIASGFTPVQTFIYIVMPQAIRQVLPVYKGEFVSLVKMTSVVGYIAVQDLTKASDIIRSRTFDAFFPLVMVAVLYFLMSWLLALGLDYLGMKTDPKRNRNIGGAKA